MSLTVKEHTSKCIIKIKTRKKTTEIQSYISFAAQPGGANIPQFISFSSINFLANKPRIRRKGVGIRPNRN
ncbi:hypothetical protein PRUPE_6G352400 [Prunus persica]|uniref:Uncharacterized protein n=1 Tax=Prunus persica TaxID=3760 RepID=A0A251P0C9_PRUPE|nr:hypothetical protein PRUPE_6G352400 [Prunus persica]